MIRRVERYEWDFGDGNQSEEMNPVHTFNESGWYNVTLAVHGKNKIKSSSVIVIGIQRPDEEKSESRGYARYWRRNTGIATVAFFQTHPNIGNPTVEFHLSVTNPVGSVIVVIDLAWDDPVNGRQDLNYIYDEYTATGNNIDLYLEIQPDDFPEEIGTNLAVLGGGYILDDGRDGGASLSAIIMYPDEVTSPTS
jgi:PKD repeat protein